MKVVITDTLFEHQDLEAEALRGVAELVVNRRYQGPEHLLGLLRDADGVISQMAPLGANVIDHLERCRVIVRYGVGVDNVDVAAATRRGIPVCNVPDYCTDEVADHTLALALALVRKLPASIDQLRQGRWGHEELRPIRRLSALTFGVYGFGRIARAVAERARAFGFRLLAHDPYVPAGFFAGAGVEQVDADSLLAESDLLALHMPLTDQTWHLLDDESFAKMKRGALVVNTARGGLIDTLALLRALDEGQVGGAALDVLETEPIAADHPLWQRPNVFMTGHLAWYSEEALRQLQRSVGEECARVLRGETPRHLVNREVAPNRA
jgi:D-3-phosphoglycerate dehydrogenase / 2-oxoglutarate reductase